jgi:hypothetical protein
MRIAGRRSCTLALPKGAREAAAMGRRFCLCTLVVLAMIVAGPANAATPSAPADNCAKLLPASEFSALTGGSFTLSGVSRSASNLETTCHYGPNLVRIEAGPTGQSAYHRWVDEATTSSEEHPCPATVLDTRDCSLSALPAYGVTTTAYRRSIVALTRAGTFVQASSPDKSLSYEQLEPVVKYLLGKIK